MGQPDARCSLEADRNPLAPSDQENVGKLGTVRGGAASMCARSAGSGGEAAVSTMGAVGWAPGRAAAGGAGRTAAATGRAACLAASSRRTVYARQPRAA